MPRIEVDLALPSGEFEVRGMLADTGAGSVNSEFELVLHEDDCLFCGISQQRFVNLTGAYSGRYQLYLVRIAIAALGFDELIPVVGVPVTPVGLDGIACFCFLNRFGYGNFGDSSQFGLER